MSPSAVCDSCSQARGSGLTATAAPGGSGNSGGTTSFGGNGPLVVAGPENGVVALTANDSHIYWLEYGTRDALESYQRDGALMSYTLADGATTVLAAGLAGPMGLALTTSHAYVFIDGGPELNAPIHPKLLRVPLAGGSPELVQDGAQPFTFTAADSRFFWSAWGAPVYSILPDSGAIPTVFVSEKARNMASDDTNIYYTNSTDSLMRTPLAGGASIEVAPAMSGFALHDDGVYTLESTLTRDAGLLRRMPKDGGESVRVRALGAGDPSGLRVVGDRYFLDVAAPGVQGPDGVYRFKTQVLMGRFEGTEPLVRLLERAKRASLVDSLWVATAQDLYWSEGQAIYKQPVPAQ